jgi:hypothetical protein
VLSVANGVQVVFGPRAVHEIRQPVVGPVAIEVANEVAIGAGADECQQDEPVKLDRLPFATVAPEIHVAVAIRRH